MKKKNNSGIVYSTDKSFSFVEEEEETTTLPNDKQTLRISLDKKARKGKQVTLISGFVGTENDLKELGKNLKAKCGAGGSVVDGEVLIQGDVRQKVADWLENAGYKVKKINF